MNDNALLTVHEIAAHVHVAPKTVRRWLREKRLEGVRLGGTRTGWRVQEANLKSFVNGEKRKEVNDR